MRTGVTLATLRKEVQIEAGLSTQAGHAVYTKERIDQLLRRIERIMATEDDWPAVPLEVDVTVNADSQYGTVPAGMTFTEIRTAHVAYGSEWLPVGYGIGARERTIHSTADRVEPLRKWQIVAPGASQFEVWPIGSVDQTIKFTGQKSVGGFNDDTDTCTLDADVLVMRTAAYILGRDNKADAQALMQEAMRLQNQIVKMQGTGKQGQILTGRQTGVSPRPFIDYIPPGSQ